ncbi:PREDICTED: uncharacterized protein LOC103336018 [Prunus mume]|uniref:Uncharacterized protein LOC103336018 n=1 Tax=Prunus mume TaxID=102107 RepID=A0ABM0PBR0_PRUMU|nr:PREDICTED: uncharacterized protein LOC103336018 [Prunus mume]
MIKEKSRAWHDLLPEALWAYRVSKRLATSTSPYALTYDHVAIVPMELKVRSIHVTERPGQEEKDYTQAMAQELEDSEQKQEGLQQEGEAKDFCRRRLGMANSRFGKFSPNWEGPFIIQQIPGRDAFQLRDRDGELHNLPINGQYLKRYTPSLWETAQNGL